MQINQAVEGFMDGFFSTRRRSEKTRTAYKTDLSQLQRIFGDERSISVIDADSLEKWADDLRSRGYAPVSIRRKFATVRVLFAYWVRKGILDSSPLWKIRMDLGRQRLLPRSLTVTDMKSLIEYIWRNVDPTRAILSSPRDSGFLALRNVAMIEILFATGIRVGELASLTCKDWCEEEASFLITGKGLRQRVALLPDQRSQRAIRTYLKHRATLSLGHDGLLVNAAGRKLSSQGIARTITMAAKRSGIKVRVTPHMIRHTVATLLLRCGADIRIVQEVLGHASIVTTQRYTYISKEHLTSTLKTLHPNHHINIELPRPADAQLLLPLF